MEQRRFRCPSCNETFARVEDLEAHAKVHAEKLEKGEGPAPLGGEKRERNEDNEPGPSR